MSEHHAGNLVAEAGGHAAGQAAEVAAVLAIAAQAAIRIREQRLAADAARERREETVRSADHAAARLVWSAADRPGFAAADGPEAARVWAAAQPWADIDPAAAEALRRAEARLGEVAPDVVADYHRRLAGGEDPAAAMYAAGAAALARAEAGHERAAAAAGFATPDLPRTRLDEHQVGVTFGEAHLGVADQEAARAAHLAGIAYPQPISAALAPPPRAAYRPAPGAGRSRGRSR